MKDRVIESRIHGDRIKILKKFIGRNKKVIDVGCGAFMPTILKVDFACDVLDDSIKFLKKDGWKGKFKKASVTDLPYKDKEFKIAICSEVIEHLRKKEDVLKAFKEIDRISINWIVTTPSAYDLDPDHTFHFGYDDDNLFDFIPKDINSVVVRKGYYYFISNNINKLKKITNAK
jgi:hypothetical protein